MKPRPQFDLEINGRRIGLGERTVVMGVLNVTPDSFSDGGRYLDPGRAIQHGLEMAAQGSDWIDVGGESTRPGSKPIPAEEELRRVLPVIRGLRERLRSLPISIDTTKAEVAEKAVRAGATILNDVSGLRFDPRLAEVARRHGTPLILMHIRGRPATMQQEPFARSIWRSVREGLGWSIRRAVTLGVHRSQLIIDPGMGFGKSRRQNFELLAHLERLRRFRVPILVGTSRKSFVQAIVSGEGLEPKRHVAPPGTCPDAIGRAAAADAGNVGAGLAPARPGHPQGAPLQLGDAATVAASILTGAHIVRVHDVAAMLPAVRIADAILKAG
jgi:dihydropteroate synthase